MRRGTFWSAEVCGTDVTRVMRIFFQANWGSRFFGGDGYWTRPPQRLEDPRHGV